MQAHWRTRQAHHGGGRYQLRLLDGARELRIRMWGLKAGARRILGAESWYENEDVALGLDW